MPTRLLLSLLALHAALYLIAAESSPVLSSVPENKTACSVDKGLFNDMCCDFCPPGTVVKQGCTATSPTSCEHCTKGADYMDHPNLNLKCLRCNICDTQHGLEVEANCTVYQNVKCRCKPGFFCSSEKCRHCDPCDKCENGAIEEGCTQTKNTVCRRSKGSLLWLLTLLLLPVLVLIIWCYWRKRANEVFHHRVPQRSTDEENEMEVQHFQDIDLSPLISNIAEEMTKEEVLKFVRKLGIKHGVIDALSQDHLNNTAELKTALLRTWYEQNGIRGAHEKLITTLRGLELRCKAEMIEQKIILGAQVIG